MNNFFLGKAPLLLTTVAALSSPLLLPDQVQALSFTSGPAAGSTVIDFENLPLGSIPDVDPPFDITSDAPLAVNSEVTLIDTVGGGGPLGVNPSSNIFSNGFVPPRPVGSTGKYLGVSGLNATFSFITPIKYFGLLWGSIDDVNVIDFISSNGTTKTFTGTQIAAAAGFDIGLTATELRTRYVNFSLADIGSNVNRVVLRNTDGARVFEVDNIAYQAIPTPALLPGLIGFGIAALRRRRGASEQA